MKRCTLLLLLSTLGCESTPTEVRIQTQPASTAQPSRAISRTVKDDSTDEAVETLKRDAYRRENRFLNALNPGYLASTTRLYQNAVRTGEVSIDEIYRIGGQLFDLPFTRREGLGTKDLKTFRRVHDGDTANLDAVRCSACHWRGGEAGAGDAADNVYFDGDGDRPSSALERNAPSLVGAGALELAARSLTIDLRARRAELLEFAKKAGYAIRENSQPKAFNLVM